MKKFMDDKVFLRNDLAESLYESVKELPIIDYHCHLSPKEIFVNRKFTDLGSLWLEGDHYKWRLMRAAGVDEKYITGSASFDEKFLEFAKVLPFAPNNPVYHWAHMELKFYFGINEPLNESTANDILLEANRQLSAGDVTTRSLMKMSKVEAVFTTDDPQDSLEFHNALQNENFAIKVAPSFRPDKAVIWINNSLFAEYVKNIAGTDVSFDKWLEELTKRLDHFCRLGCKVSDLSLPVIPVSSGTYETARLAFEKALDGNPDPLLEDDYISFMFCFFAKLYFERDIVMQLHLSSLRNNSSKLFKRLGLDCGNDSVGTPINIRNFSSLLDRIDKESGLPKTIVYTLNPNDYYQISTLLGCFQGSMIGKAQLGAAWWFCDHNDGILEHMKVLSATGLLGKFNGMLTDSRSFTSYVRHDYFRRILCSFIGEFVSNGEFELKAAQNIVKAISYENAKKYFSI